jgi:WD40 repeat protein
MKVHEYQAKELFARYGIPVPSGTVVSSAADAEAAAARVGKPVVVKAQVLVGGRGKAGGVKIAKTPAEAREKAGQILGMDIKGERVQKVEHAGAVNLAVFSADSKRLLTACSDGVARVWNLEDGKALTPPLVHDESVERVALSEDGRWVLTGAGRFVRLWDMQSGEPIGPNRKPFRSAIRIVFQLFTQ